MVGRNNVNISPWWVAKLPALRTTALDPLHGPRLRTRV